MHHRTFALRRNEGQSDGVYPDNRNSDDGAGKGHFDGRGVISPCEGVKVKKEKGSVGDIAAAGICMLAMTVLALAYMESASLLYQKAAVTQLARKYILRMETVGELRTEDRLMLQAELEELGVTDITIEGTSDKVEYGAPIELVISGRLRGKYEFREKKVSTAKH